MDTDDETSEEFSDENDEQEMDSGEVVSQMKPIYGFINKKTLDKTDYHLTEDKYGFGRRWQSAFDIPESQFIEFSPNEFSNGRYYRRLGQYHFIIKFEEGNKCKARPAIITNIGTASLFILNGSWLVQLSYGEQRILRHGDSVSVSSKKSGSLIKFGYTTSLHEIKFDLMQVPEIYLEYFVGSKLGSGGNADVMKIWKIKQKRGKFDTFALKVIAKNSLRLTETQKAAENEKYMSEVNAMKQLANPHVLQLMRWCDTPSHLLLIMELMEGGNLIGRIVNYYPNPFMDENVAKFFFKQLLEGIKYMHSKGFAHRDIKPDNILLTDEGEWPILKIGDLGLSKVLGTVNTICGTAGYSAPEIINKNRGYTEKIDLWAAGVVLYAMLSGCMPFDESYKQQSGLNLEEQVLHASINFNHRGFANVSQSAKLLINLLLERNEQKRWGADLTSAHKWVNNKATESLLRQAYLAHGINYAEKIEMELRKIALDDPAAKRTRL